MRRISSTWLLCAALGGLLGTVAGCEDDPDDLAHLHDAGTAGSAAPDAAADDDAGE